MFRTSSLLVAMAALVTMLLSPTSAFVTPAVPQAAIRTTTAATTTTAFAKNKKDDLSFIETRDMTREEMLELNAKNEEIMNMELSMMTGFSLIISLPILYLCWVAFFSD